MITMYTQTHRVCFLTSTAEKVIKYDPRVICTGDKFCPLFCENRPDYADWDNDAFSHVSTTNNMLH